MSITVDVSGMENLKEKMGSMADRIRHAVRAELYQIAEQVMRESKMVVPVDTGILMDTGHVELPEDEPDGVVSVALGYGGPAAPYALAVHEMFDTAWHHVHWTRPGSGPLYLQGGGSPMDRIEPEVSERLAGAIHDELSK